MEVLKSYSAKDARSHNVECVLDVILSLPQEAQSILKEHISTLVPSLANVVVTHPQKWTRLKGVKCIRALKALPFHVIFPYKQEILACLGEAVGDKKREVRSEAAKCNNEYYVLKKN
jgi:hypothetical protein